MFEKPMGLLAILEEESLFPKATDATFANKLHENLLGKCENFQKANPKPDPNAHFAVIHYAATVSYNLTAWLEKNKDPLNDTIVELFKNGSNSLLVQWQDCVIILQGPGSSIAFFVFLAQRKTFLNLIGTVFRFGKVSM